MQLYILYNNKRFCDSRSWFCGRSWITPSWKGEIRKSFSWRAPRNGGEVHLFPFSFFLPFFILLFYSFCFSLLFYLHKLLFILLIHIYFLYSVIPVEVFILFFIATIYFLMNFISVFLILIHIFRRWTWIFWNSEKDYIVVIFPVKIWRCELDVVTNRQTVDEKEWFFLRME